MKNSAISVVIPAFNAVTHIARAIESARASGVDLVIVVDDGSTDDTAAVAFGLGCQVLRQPNQGAARARMAGLAATSAELVIFLDADDELTAGGVRDLTAALHDNPLWTGVHGLSLCVSPDGSPRTMGAWPEGITLESLLHRSICPGPAGSFIWRVETLRLAVTSQTPALWPRFAEDYEMLLRVTMQGQIGQVKSVVCKYTLRGGKSAVSPFRDNVAAERIRRHYGALNDVSIRRRGLNEIKSMGHLRDAYALSANSNFVAKAQHILNAIFLTPSLFPRLAMRKIRRVWNRSQY